MTKQNYTEEEKDELYSKAYVIPVRVYPSVDGEHYEADVPLCSLCATADDKETVFKVMVTQIPTYLAHNFETGFEVPDFSHFFGDDDITPVLVEIDLDTRISVSAAVEARRRYNKDVSLSYEKTLYQVLAEKKIFYEQANKQAEMEQALESNRLEYVGGSDSRQKTIGSYPTRKALALNNE